MERDKLQSRMGFIMLSAASAIGIGNVWKFPYVVGQSGGGYFVLIYLIFLLILGIPMLTMEFSVGRGSQKSPMESFRVLEPSGTNWHIHGYVCLAANYLLMMFYTTVAGWMLKYFYITSIGEMSGLTADQINKIFGHTIGDTSGQLFWMAITVILGIAACYGGVQQSLEKVTKYMMTALLIIMLVLAGYSISSTGAKEGLDFFLTPNLERLRQVGILKVIVMAMNQAFFTLSIGIGSMAIFGSYIGKEHSLLGEAIQVSVLDTFVAMTSGLVIFPLCYTYNVNVSAGPSLIFLALPNVFSHMPIGHIWGGLFFLFLSFAALSTVFAVFENIVSMVMEMFNCSRKNSCLINLVGLLVLGAPCALGFSVWAWPWLKVFGGTILDLEDFLVSNLLLPCGALVYLLFCVKDSGWGWNNYYAEVNAGDGAKVKPWMRNYFTYVLPIIILFIMIYGIWEKFFL